MTNAAASLYDHILMFVYVLGEKTNRQTVPSDKHRNKAVASKTGRTSTRREVAEKTKSWMDEHENDVGSGEEDDNEENEDESGEESDGSGDENDAGFQ